MSDDIFYQSGDGLRLYAKSYGPSDADIAVLCMHGLTRNHKDFEPMIEAVGGPYRYIAVDVRGRGKSARDPNPENYTPVTYAQDMGALLDHLSIAKAVLIGTSMGGLMSVLMAQMMPDRILGVALNDVGPEIDPKGLKRISGYVGKVASVSSWDEAVERLKVGQSAMFPNFSQQDWVDIARRTYIENEDGTLAPDYDRAIEKNFKSTRISFKTRFAMWRLFSKLKPVPLLVLRGEISDLLSEKTVKRMLRRHKAASSVTVPGVGHAPILNEPVAVDAIKQFLSQF